jgi:DNA-directed RNA polymerase subunit L
MIIVQVLFRAFQLPPPQAKTSRCLPKPKIRVEHDPIHAIVASIEKIRQSCAQLVLHRYRLFHPFAPDDLSILI